MRLVVAQRSNPRAGQLPRVLELSGSLGPTNDVSFAVEQRGEVEWIPGSNVGVVHLDGAEAVPTDMTFEWRGNAFVPGEAKIDGRDVVDLDDLVDTIVSMVADAVLVDVTWRGHTRIGYMRRFEPRASRAYVYDPTLHFEWVVAPNGDAPSFKKRPSPAVFAASLIQTFEDAMSAVDEAVSAGERDIVLTRKVIDDVAQGVALVRQNLQRVEDDANSLRNVAHDTGGVLRSIAASIQQIFTTTSDIEEALAVSSDELSQTEDAYLQIKARQFRTSQLRAARLTRHQAALERSAYRAESDVLAIHTGVDGDTIWSVARIWYFDASLGPLIARRNNLISSVIRAGQRIVIPRLSEVAS